MFSINMEALGIGIFASIVGALTLLIFKLLYQHTRLVRSIWYWLSNKSFLFKIKCITIYSTEFKIDQHSIRNKIEKIGDVEQIEPAGRNYTEILFRGLQAPYLITATPSITPSDEQFNKEEVNTEVSIEFHGNMIMKYRDTKQANNIITTLEKLTNIIDKLTDEKCLYRDVLCQIMTKNEAEKWKKQNKILDEEMGLKINFGEHTMQINSKSFGNIWEGVRKYFPIPYDT
ncbi:MAG: hypothetical protein L6408_00485 [Nanoarchaeota archaeon]|nr:hypothetical protein [Nanoarchaeota archaeon]